MAIGLGDAFLVGSSVCGARGIPLFPHAVEECPERRIDGIINHIGVLDVGQEGRLLSEVEVVGQEA